MDSGSRGRGFDPSRGRTHDFVVVGSSPGRGSPSLSSLRGRYSGYHEFSLEAEASRSGALVVSAMKQSNLTTLFCAQKPKCRLCGTFYLLPYYIFKLIGNSRNNIGYKIKSIWKESEEIDCDRDAHGPKKFRRSPGQEKACPGRLERWDTSWQAIFIISQHFSRLT